LKTVAGDVGSQQMSISLRSQRGPAANSKSIFSSSLNFSWLLFSFHSIFSHPFSWLLMNFHFLPPFSFGSFSEKKRELFAVTMDGSSLCGWEKKFRVRPGRKGVKNEGKMEISLMKIMQKGFRLACKERKLREAFGGGAKLSDVMAS
jgi:hypothetical protein